MIAKKRNRIVLLVIVLLLVALGCELIYQKQTEAARKIASIHVKLHTETKTVYGKREFDVSDLHTMGKLLSFLEKCQAEHTTKESIGCEITVNDKEGSQKTYQIEEGALTKDSLLQEVLDEEEVVKQIRSFYTVEKTKIKTAEVCEWTQNVSNDVTKQQVTNKETIEHLFEICKEYTLKDPEDCAEFKQQGICFYNKKGKVLATFYFDKDSKAYKELVNAVPDIIKFK